MGDEPEIRLVGFLDEHDSFFPQATELLARLATEGQRQLDAGDVASRAEIARREGISRARVTQIIRGVRRTRLGRGAPGAR